MSSTRSVIAPPIFAEDASTTIPPTPIAGQSYRDPVAGPASSPDGWRYAQVVNSAEWNQLVYQWSTLLSIIDSKGILGWSDQVDYASNAVAYGSDGNLYTWLAASGPTLGGAKDPVSQPAFWRKGLVYDSDMVGVIGASRGAAMSVSAASASATFTADQLVVGVSLTGRQYRLSSLSLTLNTATTGAGGMDTGLAPVSGYLAVYVIYNPTTQAAALLARDVTAISAAEIYGGASMPSGYTASALVAVVPTTAARLIAPIVMAGRKVSIEPVTVLNASTTQRASPFALSIASAVPINAKLVDGYLNITSNATAAVVLRVVASSGEIGLQGVGGAGTNLASSSGCFSELPVRQGATQSIMYSATVTAGTMNATILISGYTF